MLRVLMYCLTFVIFQFVGLDELHAEKPSREFRELKVFSAEEAHQGVAIDGKHFYAIANHRIGKYEKQTGQRVAEWESSADLGLQHLNSSVVVEGQLYCAHSHWPKQPLKNSVEIWDTDSLTHVDRVTFPETGAAITWIDRKAGSWWGTFAFYGEQENVSRTVLVRFDENWQTAESWTFPTEVVKQFVPYSCSGGAWGPDGLLYVTGHDRAEIYALQVPESGTVLALVDVFPAPIAGQGIAWDRDQLGLLYGIRRKSKEVVVSRLTTTVPSDLEPWFEPQSWRRDTPGPVIGLGEPGAFDDTHIFAPCVAFEKEKFWLWHCGSTGRVAERIFSLGLATSDDGKSFARKSPKPIYSFGDGKHSVLTPTLLRTPQGNVLRENGKLRMWFSATHFAGDTGLHTLHESTSSDGMNWSEPSPPQLEHVYAPTIVKENTGYRMWYVDVSSDPWIIRHAESQNGHDWQVRPQPVLKVDQEWEISRLFYPTVVKADGVYLMWYGSYWQDHPQQTALGFAVSSDGIQWHKHPQNPVLRPDPSRAWESHYTTSQSILRLPDGSWRIWYASRKSPPFVNKYFAINTASWPGPKK